jgi:hypothetical protein
MTAIADITTSINTDMTSPGLSINTRIVVIKLSETNIMRKYLTNRRALFLFNRNTQLADDTAWLPTPLEFFASSDDWRCGRLLGSTVSIWLPG